MNKISQYRGRDSSNQKKPSSKRNYIIGRNLKKLEERTRSLKGIGKK